MPPLQSSSQTPDRRDLADNKPSSVGSDSYRAVTCHGRHNERAGEGAVEVKYGKAKTSNRYTNKKCN